MSFRFFFFFFLWRVYWVYSDKTDENFSSLFCFCFCFLFLFGCNRVCLNRTAENFSSLFFFCFFFSLMYYITRGIVVISDKKIMTCWVWFLGWHFQKVSRHYFLFFFLGMTGSIRIQESRIFLVTTLFLFFFLFCLSTILRGIVVKSDKKKKASLVRFLEWQLNISLHYFTGSV